MRKSAKSKTSTRRKRIYNPVTKSYYSVRVKSTKAGKKGTIIGKWSSAISKKRK